MRESIAEELFEKVNAKPAVEGAGFGMQKVLRVAIGLGN